jgi:hypothetical protein
MAIDMRVLLIPPPSRRMLGDNPRLNNFLDSIIADEGALTIPFAYEVEFTKGTKTTILIATGMLVAGMIITAKIAKSK